MVAIRRVCSRHGRGANATLREDFTYDAAGRRVSDARYDDLSASTLIARTTTTYDALGRILGLETRDASNTLVADFDYTYDAAGRLTSKSDDGALTTYSYDNTNQLTGEDAASDDRTYSYDANGNRTMSGYSHGSDNRLTTDGTWNYTYNDEGAMIEKERISDGLTWFYAYDHRNQLTKLEQSDNGADIDLRIEYKYDVFGNRIARSIDRDADGVLNPEVMQFALDGWNPAKPSPIGTENVDVWADLEIDGTLSTRYLRSDRVDELLARIDDLSGDPTKYWYVADHLGSTRKLLDANADVANALTYDGYGNILTETDASVRGRYAWTGREVDVEAGLQYNRARVYDATIGRWISKDPLGFAAGDSNLHRYVANNSVRHVDSSGLVIRIFAFEGLGGFQPNIAFAKGVVSDALLRLHYVDPLAANPAYVVTYLPSNRLEDRIGLATWEFAIGDAVRAGQTPEKGELEKVENRLTGKISIPCQVTKDSIVVIGYSWGGSQAIKFVRELADRRTQVQLLYLIDPVSYPRPGRRLPTAKAARSISFFQNTDTLSAKIVPEMGVGPGGVPWMELKSIVGSAFPNADNVDQLYDAARIRNSTVSHFGQRPRNGFPEFGHVELPAIDDIRNRWLDELKKVPPIQVFGVDP